MTQNSDIVHDLIRLVEASCLLSDRQKEELSRKVPDLDPATQIKLKDVLLREQKVLTEHYRNVARIHKRGAEKKIKIIYDYAERMVQKVESHELNSLEEELAQLEE